MKTPCGFNCSHGVFVYKRMVKLDVVLNKNDNFLSQGYHSLKRTLINSNEFNIAYANLIEVPVKYRRKEEGFSLAVVDGLVIAFDANGGCYNIKSMYDDGLFNTIFRDVKIIVKTQYKHDKFWDCFERSTGIKVISWIMWCTLNFPLEHFKWNPSNKFKYTSTCAGGPNSNKRWGRPPYIEWCKRDGSFHTDRVKVNDFANVLKLCKWGLILQGGNKYNCDGKNTREIEYASCGMPLALNYIPNYEYPFVPDRHFLYLRRPDDLERLKTEDPRPYAHASCELWEKYFKPESAAKYFRKLIGV